MLEEVTSVQKKVWYDLFNPAPGDMEGLAQNFGIHEAALQDCLEPDHLPKIEGIDEVTLFILRGIDEQVPRGAKTVRNVTRKLVIFVGKNFFLTVHRSRQEYLERIKQHWRMPKGPKMDSKHLLVDLIKGVLGTYDTYYLALLDRFSILEDQVFSGATSAAVFAEGYAIKRQAFVARQMLGMTASITESFELKQYIDQYQIQDLRDLTGKLSLSIQDVNEGVAALINLQISLESQRMNEASHRINEIMRVLTMFSAVFLPLSFVAGVYGMNFEHMPELHKPEAYPIVLAVMLAIAVGVLFWFWRRGWMRRMGPKHSSIVAPRKEHDEHLPREHA